MLQVVLIAVILAWLFMAYLKVKERVRWRALAVLVWRCACYPDDYRGDNPVFSFTGFDGISNLSEETKDADA